jgi:transcriptional regulator with XRE-family HTH domain
MAPSKGKDVAALFGANLRRARRDAGLSQEEVGILAELHRTEIGLLERGERMPRLDTIAKLAGAIGVSSWEVLSAGIAWVPDADRGGKFEIQ